MSRTDDNGTSAEPIASEAELLLVELLYGELEGDEARAARARIEEDAGLAAELAALEALRGVLGRIADEEPPAAVTSKLVHAASADRPRAAVPATGLWAAIKRWFQAGRSHPGVYAFATVILVAGVAGAIYIAGGSDAADEPMARSEAPAPPAGPGSGGEAIVGGMPVDEPAAVTTEAAADDDVDPAAGGYWDRGDRPDEDGEAAEPSPEPRVPESTTRRTRTAAPDPAKNQATRPANGFASGGSSGPAPPRDQKRKDAPEDEAPAGTGSAGAKSGAARQEQQSPPPPPQSTAVAGDTLDIDTTEAELKEEPAEPERERRASDQVLDLHRKATAAAKRGECPEALRLGQEIRKLDGRYFDTDFLADPLIRDCRDKARNGD
jgi:hypothetical protein